MSPVREERGTSRRSIPPKLTQQQLRSSKPPSSLTDEEIYDNDGHYSPYSTPRKHPSHHHRQARYPSRESDRHSYERQTSMQQDRRRFRPESRGYETDTDNPSSSRSRRHPTQRNTFEKAERGNRNSTSSYFTVGGARYGPQQTSLPRAHSTRADPGYGRFTRQPKRGPRRKKKHSAAAAVSDMKQAERLEDQQIRNDISVRFFHANKFWLYSDPPQGSSS